jgi:hypothetical protein
LENSTAEETVDPGKKMGKSPGCPMPLGPKQRREEERIESVSERLVLESRDGIIYEGINDESNSSTVPQF